MARKATGPRKIAATYSRVSDPNDRREASLDTQEAAQVALLESRGYFVPPELRFREKYTGMESIYDRPVLVHIRKIIAQGKLDAMSSYDTDRLARDPTNLLTVVKDSHAHGCETLFVRCDHETEGRIGEMILYMKGFASALEWDAILDRTTRGRMDIINKGQWVGGGTVKYGYRWDKESRTRTADPITAEVVRRIFRDLAAGVSLQALAAALDREGIAPPYAHAGRAGGSIWWPKTIQRLVRDRTYLGIVFARTYERIEFGEPRPDGRRRRRRGAMKAEVELVDGRTEALVSRELFDRANLAVKAACTRKGHAPKGDHLLAGRIFCGRCESRMTGTSFPVKRPGEAPYRTRVYRCFAPRLKDGPECGRRCGAGWVEEATARLIEEKVLKPGYLEAEVERLAKKDDGGRERADLERAERRRKKVDRDIRQLMDWQLDNADEEPAIKAAFRDKLKALGVEASDLDDQIADLRDRLAAAGGRGERLAAFLRGIGRVREKARGGRLDPADVRDIIEALNADVLAWVEDDGERRVDLRLPTETEMRRATSGHTMYHTPRNGPAHRDGVIVLESGEAA